MFDESVSSSPTFWSVLNSWFTPTVFFVVLQLVIGTIYITSTLFNDAQKRHHHQQQEQDPQGAENPQAQQLARSPSSVLQRLKSINFYSYTYRSPEPFSEGQVQNAVATDQEFQTHEREHPQIARSPSVLQRFKSINLYNYFPTEPISSKFTRHESVTQDDDLRETHETGKEEHHLEDTAVIVEETDEEKEENDVVGQIRPKEEEPSSLDEVYSQLQGQGDGHFTRTQSDTKPASGEVPVKLPRKMKKSASTKSAFSHFKEDDIVAESSRPATVREEKVSAAEDEEVDAKADDFINKFKQQLKLQRLDSIMRYKEMIGRGSGK